MAKWTMKDINIYFNDIKGELGENCLPYLPESFGAKIDGSNEEIDMLTIGSINLLKIPKLKTFSIDCFFAHPDKPEFAKVKKSEKWTPKMWVDFFESAMNERKVLEMTVTGIDLICNVTVENFEWDKRSGEELDTYYTITLKEYKEYEIKAMEIKIEQKYPKPEEISQIPIKDGGNSNGSIKWLVGYAYHTRSTNLLTTPILYYKTYGTKIIENVAHFDWLKVKVEETKTISEDNNRISTLGRDILEVFKTDRTYIEQPLSIDYFTFVIGQFITNIDIEKKGDYILAKECVEKISPRNGQGARAEAQKLYNFIISKAKKEFGSNLTNEMLEGSLVADVFSEKVKKYFLQNEKELKSACSGIYMFGDKIETPVCNISVQEEFKVKDKVGNQSSSAKPEDYGGETAIATTYSIGHPLWCYETDLRDTNPVPTPLSIEGRVDDVLKGYGSSGGGSGGGSR